MEEVAKFSSNLSFKLRYKSFLFIFKISTILQFLFNVFIISWLNIFFIFASTVISTLYFISYLTGGNPPIFSEISIKVSNTCFISSSSALSFLSVRFHQSSIYHSHFVRSGINISSINKNISDTSSNFISLSLNAFASFNSFLILSIMCSFFFLSVLSIMRVT